MRYPLGGRHICVCISGYLPGALGVEVSEALAEVFLPQSTRHNPDKQGQAYSYRLPLFFTLVPVCPVCRYGLEAGVFFWQDILMKCAIIYSSVTGNTESVARAILDVMPAGTEIFSVKDAPEPEDFDFLALGFWVDRARPSADMWKYMERVQGKKVACFGTMSAWPDSAHAMQVIENIRERLRKNTMLGEFLCLGRLPKKRLDTYFSENYHSESHPMTEERKARLKEGMTHPDETDFAAARNAFAGFLEQAGASIA